MNIPKPSHSPEELAGLVPDIRYDNVFKAIFADEGNEKSLKALSGFLSAVIERPLTVVGILQNEPAPEFASEKQIRYDINCVFGDGSRCNAEMTLHPVRCEPIRIEYYACKAHVGQRTKGKKFGELVPTYQVSVLNDDILADTAYLHCFSLYDPVRKISLSGHIRVFTLELSKVKKIAKNKPVRKMTPAERWAAYFLYNADGSVSARRLIKKIAKEEESVKMATEVMQAFSEDEKKYYLLLSQMKYEMDHCNLMIDAEERGEERGIQIGREDERRKSEAVIADKDAEIARLRALIADSQ
ncbi:MAG: Rpn family recombination-promoting nuclease/putative transposase [Clostridiales Family XIII bacterium]|jgi:predicted transposase/invertase (TIGR01784 family)|nr:Rpn family recombination-promoting nuclease/putative transposase [Clostridiales Family XIII bacterium]